ncbi:MAG: hypothetical protein IJY82_07400 [Oscillospiraceae bacterium]|nr:hypothetical protein [Oscillospiraceae bacterium]
MKRSMKRILSAIVVAVLVFGLTACNGGGEAKDDKLILSWINWSGGPVRDDGTYSLWDSASAEMVKVNQISTYYLAKKSDGSTVFGVPTNEQLEEVMEHAKYDIDLSHEKGIRVIGYSDTVQFSKESATAMGYTVDELVAVGYGGQQIVTTAWYKGGLYVACINSPEWRNWLSKNLKATAEAGFDGLQYDLHPYAAAGMFCQCDHCVELWAKRSEEKLGTARTIPNAFDFSTEEGRVYWQWKMDCFGDFLRETTEAAKKENPDFILLMNNNVTGTNFGFEALGGVWDMPTSEHGNTSNGYESTLFMYQMAEALGYSDLYAQYGTDDEIDPIFRYKVNLAESFAVNGGLSYVSDKYGVGSAMFTFAGGIHSEAYTGTKSIAKVAILWSVESNVYSIPVDYFQFVGLLHPYAYDFARQTSAALVKSGITYDYLALEPEGVLDRLNQYDVLVLPEYTYFNSETWEPVLKAIAERGKKLIVLGRDSKEFVNSDADHITYVPNFTQSSGESSLTVSKAFMDALKETGATNQVSIKNNQDVTAVTARKAADGNIYLHVIRRGGDDNLADRTAKLEFTLPEGFQLDTVTGENPFVRPVKVDVEYSLEGNTLSIESEKFDTYLLLTLKAKS